MMNDEPEMKIEELNVDAKPQGYICPKSEAQFRFHEYFMKHIKEHHENLLHDNYEFS